MDTAAVTATRHDNIRGNTRLIDRYLVVEISKPLMVSLLVVLTALLLERLLRLFDLIAHRGGAFDLILRMAANLVPHYLGLALPAAFFISIFVAVARLGNDNELDALQAGGLSIRRLCRPFLAIGLVLAVFSVALFGFIQPYSRYGYRALYHAVTNAAWDATVTESTFIDAGDGVTISADMVDATGRELTKVFVHQIRDGAEWVTTAAGGRVDVTPDLTHLQLTLRDGVQVRTTADGAVQTLRFGSLVLDRDFSLTAPPYRARGSSERELTLPELWQERTDPASVIERSRLEAEFHARLVRAVSMPLLPLLAIPLGMAAKRQRRGEGIAIAAVIMVTYHHAIQLGESLADLGRIDAAIGIWTPFFIFALICFVLFRQALIRPGANPFGTLLERIDRLVELVAGRLLGKGKAAP